MTVHTVSILAEPAVRVVVAPEVEVVGDVEVEVAVAVDIEKAGAGAPLRRTARHAGRRRHIRECAVAVVLVQEVGAEAGDVEVEIAVAVVVADGDAGLVGVLARAAAVHARLRGHVAERAVTVVAVEHVCRARRAVDEVQILKTVVVVVDPRDARAEGLDHVLLRGGARLVHEIDFRPGSHVDKQRGAIGLSSIRLARYR